MWERRYPAVRRGKSGSQKFPSLNHWLYMSFAGVYLKSGSRPGAQGTLVRLYLWS